STSDRVAIIWDAADDSKETTRLICDTWLGNALFLPNLELVVGIGGHGRMFLWSSRTSKLLRSEKAHDSDSVALAIDKSLSLLASADKKGYLKLWSISKLTLGLKSSKGRWLVANARP